MKALNTYSILFWLKLASAKNVGAPLYARITIDGKRAKLSLKQKILISDWEAKKNRLKGLLDETKKVNTYLKHVNSQLFEAYQNLKRERKFVTSNLLKANFLGTDQNRYLLTDIIKYHNEHMKSTLR